MAESLKSVRGMNDLLPPESAMWLDFEDSCRRVFERHGYGEIRTPIVESTALFARGIGDDTDIVGKEMYTFPDRKGRSLTLRPEMTASCVRAYIQHSMVKKEPITRWYYMGQNFRYERVQAGRYRQFFQVGVEAFGVSGPTMEAEQIAMAYQLYRELGLPADALDVIINSVGDETDRPRYRKALVAFLVPAREQLCSDCQRRVETNPLRVLDCKVPACKALVADAPLLSDHLSEASEAHFAGVRQALTALAIPFRVDPKLVRGLDYYTGTVFEIVSQAGKLGAQGTLVAGGRYNRLVQNLGGPEVPAVGWAAGIERAMLSLADDAAPHAGVPDLFIGIRGDAARLRGLAVAHTLRAAGLRVDIEHRDVGVKGQLKRADKLGARYVIVLGERELESGRVGLKAMQTRETTDVEIDSLAGAIPRT